MKLESHSMRTDLYPTIAFGDVEKDGSSPNRQEVGVRRVYHSTFAILQLDPPVTITDYVRPICLNSEVYDEWDTYDNCWIAGWGRMDARGKSVIRLYSLKCKKGERITLQKIEMC